MATLEGLQGQLDLCAQLDAQNIKEACAGLGTDDDALTDVLCNRSKQQVYRINEAHKKMFGKTLLTRIKSECGGAYRQFMVKMVAEPAEADADALFAAMDGM